MESDDNAGVRRADRNLIRRDTRGHSRVGQNCMDCKSFSVIVNLVDCNLHLL